MTFSRGIFCQRGTTDCLIVPCIFVGSLFLPSESILKRIFLPPRLRDSATGCLGHGKPYPFLYLDPGTLAGIRSKLLSLGKKNTVLVKRPPVLPSIHVFLSRRISEARYLARCGCLRCLDILVGHPRRGERKEERGGLAATERFTGWIWRQNAVAGSPRPILLRTAAPFRPSSSSLFVPPRAIKSAEKNKRWCTVEYDRPERGAYCRCTRTICPD